MEMQPEDFISLARYMLCQEGGKPSNASLRRSLSTVYYAMFHTLAKTGADLLIGELNTPCSEQAWRRVYRGLDHGRAKLACRNQNIMSKFPSSIQEFGSFFVEMQEVRHSADYDPRAEFGKPLTKYFVEGRIDYAEGAMQGFNSVDKKDHKNFPLVFCYSKKTRL